MKLIFGITHAAQSTLFHFGAMVYLGLALGGLLPRLFHVEHDLQWAFISAAVLAVSLTVQSWALKRSK